MRKAQMLFRMYGRCLIILVRIYTTNIRGDKFEAELNRLVSLREQYDDYKEKE
jgi:hypothetical protein